MYDPAGFFTTKEVQEKFDLDVNVQRKVETPELYIIGRCRNNDEQFGYIETRVDCLKDCMRVFHNDGSALVTGNQKGGHYFCPSCDIHICQTDDISCCYHKKFRSLAYNQNEVLKGKFGKINSSQKHSYPFEKLSVNQLQQELQSRSVDISHLKKTKKDLLPKLKKPLKRLGELGLDKFEVSMIECMHDLAHHIENVLEELPHHLSDPHKSQFNDMLKILKLEKEKRRCCEWRKMLLIITQTLYQKIDGKVHKLLKTLSDIQQILYF